MKCIVRGCEDTELVYSGVDCMVLGVPSEKVCYPHANSYAQVSVVVLEQIEQYETMKGNK
jgi:hypothetical protein